MKSGLSKYEGVLLEEMNERYKLIMELLQLLPGMLKDIRELKEDAIAHRDWQVAATQALKDISKSLHNQEGRITKLENA